MDLWDFKHQALRPGQKTALGVIFDRCVAGEQFIAIVLPTRYGKTDVQRIAAVQLHKHGIIGAALSLSPATILRDQCASQRDWQQCISRYDLPVEANEKYRRVMEVQARYTGNGEVFLAATIQLVCQNIDNFCQFADSLFAAGKPLLIFIDECHTASIANMWGKVAKRLADAGALICLLTGTAIRDDKTPIVGFEVETVPLECGQIVHIRKGSSDDTYRVDKFIGTWQETKLVAHHETTFANAWEESPSPLCNFSHTPFDVHLGDVEAPADENSDQNLPFLLLSDLPAARAQKWLGRVCWNRKVIEAGVRLMVGCLRTCRKSHPNIGAIIFCGVDNGLQEAEGGDNAAKSNAHARAIKAAILAQPEGENLSVVIATSTIEDAENDAGAVFLKRFKEGHGDILIVKQMGGMGFDCPRLKVLLDLSPVRTYAAWVQRVMRIATPYKDITNCHLIHPNDCLSERMWKHAIEAQGGDAATRNFEIEGLIASYEKKREDDGNGDGNRSDNVLSVIGTSVADFDDNRHNVANGKHYEYVRWLVDLFPVIGVDRTDAQIANELKPFIEDVQANRRPAVDLETQIRVDHQTITDLANELAALRIDGGYTKEKFQLEVTRVRTDLNRTIGISTMTGVTEIGVLQRAKAELQRRLILESNRKASA